MKNNIKIVFGAILCVVGGMAMFISGTCAFSLIFFNPKGILFLIVPLLIGVLVFSGGIKLIQSTKEPSAWKDPLKRNNHDQI